jgi:hypothetical protein
MSTKTIVSNPCSKDWDEMTEVNNGKFCGSCKKTVVDFTSWKDEDIKKHFQTKSETTCGYFNESQVVIKRKWHHEFLVNLHYRTESKFNIPILRNVVLKLIVISMFAVGCNSTETFFKNNDKDNNKTSRLHGPRKLKGHVPPPTRDSRDLWD